MRPRTKLEKRVAELNATLSEDIAASNAEWVKQESSSWNMRYFCYFTIFTKIHEFDVKRLYRAYKYKAGKQDLFIFVEILRTFNDGTNELIFAKQRTMGLYYDSFIFHSDIELRRDVVNYGGYSISMLNHLSLASACEDYASTRIRCATYNPKDIARVVRNNPVAENLYKANDPLFGWVVNYPHAQGYCRAITLAKRHGFVFDEYTTPLWFDMVSAIMYCGKDYHNPVNIAPKDIDALRMNHDKFIRMMQNKQERERRRRIAEQQRIEEELLKKELEMSMKMNDQYIKRRRRFYDMVLTDGLIECRVLRDVQAFAEEGEVMKHCVFRCKYFAKPHSLILSARINDERIETIEVDLTKYEIKQCYGKHDQFTMYHKRILDLVNSQMDTIKAYNRNKVSQLKKAM